MLPDQTRPALRKGLYLRGQLLLSVRQALDVSRVVAAALAGRDGAFNGAAGHLGGDGCGGAEGLRA